MGLTVNVTKTYSARGIPINSLLLTTILVHTRRLFHLYSVLKFLGLHSTYPKMTRLFYLVCVCVMLTIIGTQKAQPNLICQLLEQNRSNITFNTIRMNWNTRTLP